MIFKFKKTSRHFIRPLSMILSIFAVLGLSSTANATLVFDLFNEGATSVFPNTFSIGQWQLTSSTSVVTDQQIQVGRLGRAGTVSLDGSSAGNGITSAFGNWSGGTGVVVGFGNAAPGFAIVRGGRFETLGSIDIGSGNGGNGRLGVIEGGTVKATRELQFSGSGLIIGGGNAAVGSVLVDGAGSRLDVTDRIIVAQASNSIADLTISNGGIVSTHSDGTNENFDGNLQIGTETGASGIVTVTGNGSRLETGGIFGGGGFGGQGQIHIENGGTVTVADIGGLTPIGRLGGVVQLGGTIDITGSGSKLQISPLLPDNISFGSGEIKIGGFGTGSVTVDNNGLLDVTGGAIDLGLPATFGASDPGILNVRNGGTVNANTITVGQSGTLTGGNGTINADVIVDGGIVAPGNSPGTMIINGNADFSNGILELEITRTAMDLLVITGDLTLGDNLMISLLFDFDPTDFVLDFSDFFDVAGDFLTGQNFNLTNNVNVFGLSNTSRLSVNFRSDQRSFGTTPSVPEPAPLALLMLGLFGFGIMRKRRA